MRILINVLVIISLISENLAETGSTCCTMNSCSFEKIEIVSQLMTLATQIQKSTKLNCGVAEPSTTTEQSTSTTNEPKKCPNDWTQYQNKCFKMANVMKNHADAKSTCQSEYNGDMITIQSDEEQRFVENFMKSGRWNGDSNTGWIDGEGSKLNGFSWNDKSPMNYTNWDYAQPDNMGMLHAPANCMAILLVDQGAPWTFGKWHDLECEYEHFFACQRVL